MPPVVATSIQSPIAHDLCRGVVTDLGRRLGIDLRFDAAGDWRRRAERLSRGSIDIGWVCGQHYVADSLRTRPAWRLLAAPVMVAQRYAGRPSYFSDVVVHAHSKLRRFADLRGCRWAFNEPRSHSGWGVVLAHLDGLGEHQGYFGEVIEAGCHACAIDLVREGRADAAAIDSTVLEHLALSGSGVGQLRTVATLGPSPMPPWVVHRSLPASQRAALRRGLIHLHEDAAAAATLAAWGVTRFVAVTDRDYAPIRRMMMRVRRTLPYGAARARNGASSSAGIRHGRPLATATQTCSVAPSASSASPVRTA